MEVINGVPGEVVKFIYYISPIMELETGEIEAYLGFIQEDYAISEEQGVSCGEETRFAPKQDAVDYESKKIHRNEFTYICPHCYREIDECRCLVYPYYLVQIDTLIVPIIRTLNKKGYITSACCSGHIYKNHCTNIHIAFRDEHNFGNDIPEGAVYSKVSQMIRFDGLDKMNTEERKVFQAECIVKLTAWVDNLPVLG